MPCKSSEDSSDGHYSVTFLSLSIDHPVLDEWELKYILRTLDHQLSNWEVKSSSTLLCCESIQATAFCQPKEEFSYFFFMKEQSIIEHQKLRHLQSSPMYATGAEILGTGQVWGSKNHKGAQTNLSKPVPRTGKGNEILVKLVFSAFLPSPPPLATYSKGTLFRLLSESVLSRGDSWWFVFIQLLFYKQDDNDDPQGPVKFPHSPQVFSANSSPFWPLLFPSLRFIVYLTHWLPHTCLRTFLVIVSNRYLLQYSLQTFSMLSFSLSNQIIGVLSPGMYITHLHFNNL